MPVTLIITDAGRAALVNAENNGTAPMTIAEFGVSETDFAASAATTVLTGEVKRVSTLSGSVVDDDTIHIVVRDESTDVFDLRSCAIYLDDGTLFAVYSQSDPILSKAAQSVMLLAVDVKFADIAAASLTFGDANFLNPPATTEVQGVVKLSTLEQAQAGIDALTALTPEAANAAILGWLLAQDGSGSGLDADLLDGQHASYFTDIIARLGYAPVDKAGDTMSGDLAIARNTNWPGIKLRSNFVSPSVANGVIVRNQNEHGIDVGAWQFFMDTDGSTVAQVRVTPPGDRETDRRITALQVLHDQMLFLGSLLWHSGNDGSGSGLDADKLDGQHASYFTDILARLGYTPINKAGDSGVGNLNFLESVFLEAADREFLWTNGVNLNLGHEITGDVLAKGSKVWHAGNDGAGSGLDADLLDGKHASSFLLAAAYTAADILSKLKGVDGSGSGLDADMLDGKHASSFLLAAAYTAADVLSKLKGVDGSGSGLDADLLDGKHASSFLLSSVYTAANVLSKLVTVDGSGSGLDADKLDGKHASAFELAFVKVTDTTTKIAIRIDIGGTNFYLQMGEGNLSGNNSTVVTFPQAYSTRCFAMACGGSSNTNTEGNCNQSSHSLTSVTITNSGGDYAPYAWIAFGR